MAAIVETLSWRGRLIGRDGTTVYLLNPDFVGWTALPALPAGSAVALSVHGAYIVAVNGTGVVYRGMINQATGAWAWAQIAASP